MSTIERLAVLLLAVLLAAGCGYRWGRSDADAAAALRIARANAEAAATTRAAEARADTAAAAYLTEHLEQESRYAELQKRDSQLARRGVPLIAHAPVAACPAGGAAAPAGSEPSAPAAVVAVVPVAVADPELTRRAVWMWNSALVGADVPSGACGLAGGAAGAGAAGACAEPAGVSVEDAWANHTVNAESCAADRARYRRLIQVLRERGLVEQEPR